MNSKKNDLSSVTGELSLADLAQVRGGLSASGSLAAVKAKVEAGSNIKSEDTDRDEGGSLGIAPTLIYR